MKVAKMEVEWKNFQSKTPKPAAAVLPGNSSERQTFNPTPDLLNQKLWGGAQ
jgi:hypothetical protein